MASRRKLPGWLLFLLGVFTGLPDWYARFDFWWGAVKQSGGVLGVVAALIGTPYFGPTLTALGVAYVLFVGEPRKTAQRHAWWPYIGWSVFGLCLTAIAVVSIYGYVQVTIKQQVGTQVEAIQRQALASPVFWHMTDYQKYTLGHQLETIPENERFEVVIKCLSSANSQTFATDVLTVFNDKKWKMKPNCFFTNLKPDLVGFYLTVAAGIEKMEDVPFNAARMAKILAAAQIPFEWSYDPSLTKDQFCLSVGNAPALPKQ